MTQVSLKSPHLVRSCKSPAVVVVELIETPWVGGSNMSHSQNHIYAVVIVTCWWSEFCESVRLIDKVCFFESRLNHATKILEPF